MEPESLLVFHGRWNHYSGMEQREATEDDLDLLAEWNLQLIEDEGHRNSMGIEQLRERMKGYLSEGYQAVLFSEDGNLAYALYRENEHDIYLRQFFVRRDRRREGIGRTAMQMLFAKWPKKKRLTVGVLINNTAAIAFWRAMGYADYCLFLEKMR